MKEYIIKVGDEPDIMGNYPLTEKAKELVRCKDCKYYHKPEYGFTIGDCTYRSAWYPVREEEFCSLACKKDGDGNG